MIHLHDLIENLRKKRVWVPSFKSTIAAAMPQQSAWILANASDAMCFDMGYVEDIPKLKIIPDLFRLPYSVTWFESQNADGLLGVLAVEVGEHRCHCAVFNKRIGAAWQLVGVVESLPVDDRISAVAFSPDDPDDGAFRYAAAAVCAVGKYVMAINCSNVSRTGHDAPKFLNRKRAEKGRQPLFSYWTLHITNTEKVAPTGGTHASPRLHLRRGHIRQYAAGKYTWVDAHAVGSKSAGVVHKDYSGPDA